jgi:NAD(P)-dependent dehydrogenase (short-subunit alcohol dehydrogenase family)
MRTPLVVITGAAGALGRAVAADFLARGARLALVDVDSHALEALYAGQGSGHLRVPTDLVDPVASAAALGAVFAEHGPAAVLCNIAGGFDAGAPVHETKSDVWQRMQELNVVTLVNACRATVPGMIAARRGRIVNVAAASAVSGKPGMGAYCAAKSAVARLTESMALELRGNGINVNAVAPSIIDTPANRAAMPGVDPAAWVSTKDLAAVIRFLASDDAAAIHGAVIPVVGLV